MQMGQGRVRRQNLKARTNWHHKQDGNFGEGFRRWTYETCC